MSSGVDNRTFELIGGHPAVDLVNTLDWRFRDNGPDELLASYSDLLRFAGQSELLTEKQLRQITREAPDHAAAATLVACRDLREAAAEVLYAAVDDRTPAASQIKTLDQLFKEARESQRLVWSGAGLRWEWPASERGPDLPLWILSITTAQLLVSEDMGRMRACENPECRWLFLDTSKNHTRRWCDMKICGNRMKARRFKAQHRGSAPLD